MDHEEEKKGAARRSMDFVQDGDVVGLGTGTTAGYAIRFLADRVRAGLNVRAIATSNRTAEIAARLGIPLTSLDTGAVVDVDIDGADQVSSRLDLIKGHGGALLREKIVASASRRVVIIADSSKKVAALGNFPVPVEVVRFAQGLLAQRVAACGGSAVLRTDQEGRPFTTDEGNHILDCNFGVIPDPARPGRRAGSPAGGDRTWPVPGCGGHRPDRQRFGSDRVAPSRPASQNSADLLNWW